MSHFARRCSSGRAIHTGCALAALFAAPASAQGEQDVSSPNSFALSGDVRMVSVGGEKSWVDGGFGKFRSGGGGGVEPQLGNLSLVWKPQLTWSVSAVVVAMAQGGQRPQAGLSQAYLAFRPMRSTSITLSARAGLMWPPVSLEHEGSDWHVKDSITPSAINSWIGEEVKPLAVEATVAGNIGEHQVRTTAALVSANDTAGTLLTFRGWAFHDRVALAFNSHTLPPLGEFTGLQARYTHPLLDVHQGFAKRIGYYAKLSWQPPVAVRIEVVRYDNGGFPQDVTSVGPEWGWRTRFNEVAVVANLGSNFELKSQALEGMTRMGFSMPVRRWVDERFRSAYALLAHSAGHVTFAVRGDVFDTRARGSLWTQEYGEKGWAAMISAKRDWRHVSALIELLHVHSDVPAREFVSEAERQSQTQLQTELRMHW